MPLRISIPLRHDAENSREVAVARFFSIGWSVWWDVARECAFLQLNVVQHITGHTCNFSKCLDDTGQGCRIASSITVSHVWDRGIAEAQNTMWKRQVAQVVEDRTDAVEEAFLTQRPEAEDQVDRGYNDQDPRRKQTTQQQFNEEFEEARRLAYEIPLRIYREITDGIGERIELWHDYISVPQWELELKMNILPRIPEIFKKARFTLVYMHDVSGESVDMLQSGSSPEERLEGAIRVCNSVWFSRVWTAMEYIRSHELRVMIKNEELVDGARQHHDLFLENMRRAWAEGEAKYVSKAKVVEPWQ